MRNWLAKVLNRRSSDGGSMQQPMISVLANLKFDPGPVETLYLDEARVNENFIGQLGAIASYTNLATKEIGGGVEAPVVKIDASGSSQSSVTWNLNHPIIQALVLRKLAVPEVAPRDFHDAKPGRYLVFSEAGAISRPRMFDDLHREHLQAYPELYERLEAERAAEENDLRSTNGPDEDLWLLTVSRGPLVCAATLMDSMLRPPFRHWVSASSDWEIFGLCRRFYEDTQVPWLAPLHLRAKF